MSYSVNDIVSLLCTISKDRKMKAAVKKKFSKTALLAGAGIGAIAVITGGIVGAVAFIGAVGSLLHRWMTSGKFKSVSEILKMLSPAQKEKLTEKANDIIRKYNLVKDAKQLNTLVLGNKALKEELLNMLAKYLKKELRAKIRFD